MTRPSSAVVLYDRDCGFCVWSVNVILAWDRAGRTRAVPIQSDEGASLLGGLEPAQRLDSWHLITAAGELYSAGAAAAPLVRILPFGRPLAALLAALPGPTERVYRIIARRRARWARLLGIDASCEASRR